MNKKRIKICLVILANDYDEVVLEREFRSFITEICSDGQSELEKFSLKELKKKTVSKMNFIIGDNPCGFCEDGNMHEECDTIDCTCSCPYGDKPKKRKLK